MTTPRTSYKIDDSNPVSSCHMGREDHLRACKNHATLNGPRPHVNDQWHRSRIGAIEEVLHDNSYDSPIDGLRITTGDDRDYSRKLVSHARQVHVFSYLYQNSVPPAGQFYSCSGDDVSPS
ncbi:hypothetical protein C4D60_Mb06t16230 [Musa balbisiana]|uniref:Uncharacterized protein n=1 Tax=Musa balbisiana TaxID=52838 RepID=A0A4S8INE0_MUSBA|nr:hypothetical protein C4D60_Mb06t16230 [Musa balbisiana]